MKTGFKYIAINLFSAILLLQSCEKLPFDYRTKYIGEWDLRSEVHIQITSGPGMGEYDNVYHYDAEIKYGPEFDEIIILYGGSDHTFKVNKYGEFGPAKVYNNSTNWSSYSGKFEGRKKFSYTEYGRIEMKRYGFTINNFGKKK